MKVKIISSNAAGAERDRGEEYLPPSDPFLKMFEHEGPLARAITVEYADGSKLRFEKV